LPLGAICEVATNCDSGHCAEGVCCDRPCDGSCEACNVVGEAGTCQPTPGLAPLGVCAEGAVCSADARCVGAHRWSELSGAAGVDDAAAVAVAPDGAVVVGGIYTDELSLGGGLVTPAGGDDASGYVVGLDAEGHRQWSVTVGRAASVDAVAVTPEGTTVVAGSLTGQAMLFGEPTQAEAVDGYVAALDGATGDVLWQWRIDGEGAQRVEELLVLPSGDIVVGVSYSAEVVVGEDLYTSAGASSALVVALTPAGLPRWSWTITSTGNDRVGGMAVTAEGDVLVTGAIVGPAAVRSGGSAPMATLDHAKAEDVFLLRLDGDGGFLDARSYGGQGSDVGRAVVGLADGGLALAGFFTKSIDFGGHPMLSAGCEDVFLVRLGPDLEPRFSRRFGDDEPQVPHSMSLGPDGSLLLAGELVGELDFGWGPLASAGQLDVWVAAFDLHGEPRWGKRFGGPGRDRLGSAVVAQDVMVLAGRVEGTIDFGGEELEPVGGLDAFVAALQP
jgi:hypothetical protein